MRDRLRRTDRGKVFFCTVLFIVLNSVFWWMANKFTHERLWIVSLSNIFWIYSTNWKKRVVLAYSLLVSYWRTIRTPGAESQWGRGRECGAGWAGQRRGFVYRTLYCFEFCFLFFDGWQNKSTHERLLTVCLSSISWIYSTNWKKETFLRIFSSRFSLVDY